MSVNLSFATQNSYEFYWPPGDNDRNRTITQTVTLIEQK